MFAPAPLASAFLAGLALATGGCARQSDVELKDTEGRQVKLRCEDGKCALGGGISAPALEIRTTGRLVGLCSAGDAGPASCRPIVCDSDASCPPAERLERGSCVSGLCIEPAAELTAADAVLLCLAGTGSGRSTQLQVERYAMALNCGSPCIVPKPCRQP
jgi:hypothetical protein